MNLKFWRWARELRELRTLEKNHREFNSHVLEVAAENGRLKKALGEAEGHLAAVFARVPEVRPGSDEVKELRRARLQERWLLALAEVSEDNPLFQTVLEFMDEHLTVETRAALNPHLSDAGRHYCAGRAASAYDVAAMLRELRWQAEREASKIKAKD